MSVTIHRTESAYNWPFSAPTVEVQTITPMGALDLIDGKFVAKLF